MLATCERPGCKNPTRRRGEGVCACPTSGVESTAPSPTRTSRLLVCRERSIVRSDGGRFTTPPPSRLEARSRLTQHRCSFDHLVGALLKMQRHLESKRFGGLEIDNQFEFDR